MVGFTRLQTLGERGMHKVADVGRKKSKGIIDIFTFSSTMRSYFAKPLVKMATTAMMELFLELKLKNSSTSEVKQCQTGL